LQKSETQLLFFHGLPHSFTKTRGCGVLPSRLGSRSLHCPNTSGPIIVSWYSTHAPPPDSHRSDSVALPAALVRRGGWLAGPAFLHPIRRELTPDLIREADSSFAATGSTREDFDVTAPDGSLLRGWKVRPKNPNGSWVLLFHGVADNRVGVIGQSEFLLRAGYSIVMMDARAHGASGGPIATYGWLERNDTRAIIDALLSSEHVGAGPAAPASAARSSSLTSLTSSTSLTSPFHLFALGESMGAGIVLQSAAADPRIEAVVAEASFANMREASYDYAGLRKYPSLGKTLFVPFSWTLLYRGEKLAGFPLAEVSPLKAVASRAFPVLLICDEKDVALPCRHSEMIYAAARGPKELWVVPGAFHTAAYGFEPQEFRRRVLSFFATYASNPPTANLTPANPAPSQNKFLPVGQAPLRGDQHDVPK
jgi:alpha-beta hydrolase superfamily lysophospholipase